MKSIHISDVYKLDDAKQKIDNLIKYYQNNRFKKSILDSVLINAASQSLQINLNNEYIVINYLILAILKQNTIQNSVLRKDLKSITDGIAKTMQTDSKNIKNSHSEKSKRKLHKKVNKNNIKKK